MTSISFRLVRTKLIIGSSLLLISVLAIFTIGLYMPSQAFSLVFLDDFESHTLATFPAGYSDTVPSGTWTIVDDGSSQVLEQADPLLASPADPIAFAPGTASDMIFEAQVKIKDADGYAGLVFRALDRDNLYLYQIYSADDEIKLFKREAGVWTLLTAAPVTFDIDTFYRLQVIAVDDEILGFVDGDPVFEFVDTTFTAGSFGFRTHLTKAHFDNAVVLEPPFDLRGETFEGYLLDSDATPFFIESKGNWKVKDDGTSKVMRQTNVTKGSPDDPLLFSSEHVSEVGDMILEADVKVRTGAGTNAGVIFRVQDRDNLYLFRINTAADTAALFKREAGTYTSLGSTAVALSDNAWYRLKVIAVGDKIATFVDGVPMQSVTDATYDEGAFGFRTHLTRADFDNLLIFEAPFDFIVDDDGVECPDRDFDNIQEAVDFSAEGAAVSVCGGEYDEQVVVDKDLTIQAFDAADKPVIKPTAVATNSTRLSNGNPVGAIVLAEDEVSLALRDLIIDGSANGIAGCGAPDPRLFGLFYRNASGSAVNTEIVSMELAGLPTCGRGVGLLAESDGAGESSFTVQSSVVSDYQKLGILGYGPNTNLDILDTTVTGWGPTSDVVQFGIRLKAGATGRIFSSEVSGNVYTPGSARAVGVHLDSAGDGITMFSNNIHDNEVGVLVEDTDAGTFISNDISDSTDAALEIDPSGNWNITGNNIDGSGNNGIVLINVSDSNLVGNEVNATSGSGIKISSASGSSSTANQLIGNRVTGSTIYGIVLQPATGASNLVSGNRLVANNVADSGADGIRLNAGDSAEVNENEILANQVSDSGEQGIHLIEEDSGQVDENDVKFNQVDDSGKNGIKVKKGDDNDISFNQVTGSTRNGIRLSPGAKFNTVTFNSSLGNGNGATTFDLNCAVGVCPSTTRFGNIFGTASPPAGW